MNNILKKSESSKFTLRKVILSKIQAMENYLKYFFALVLFGSNGIVASRISLTSYEIVFWRTGIGALLLIGLFICTKRKITLKQHKKDFMFISLSGIAMGLGWIFLYEAYAQIGVGLSSLLYYCGPVIVMLLSPVLFHERLTFTKIVGFIMVIAGVFFVNNFAPERAMNRFGLICGGVSALMYSVMVILNKQSKNISGFENAMVQLTASFLTVAVFTGLKSGFIIYIEAEEWLWIIMLGALNTGIGCLLYFSAISKLHVQTVAICGYIEPLSAVLLSFVLLKEAMFPLQVLGAGFILVGALISEISLKKWANKGI